MASIQIKVPDWLERICVLPVTEYRRWKYGYSYRRIYLGEGEWTIVEPKDYYWLSNFNWTFEGGKKEKCYYAVRNTKTETGQTKTIRMHRDIMNAPSGLLVDHRNRNPLDNRRANLRLATHSQNMQNREKIGKKTTSRFKGVSFDKKKNLWRADICYRGKIIFLGYFENEIDAARAYDAAAKKYHGEFARLNFPE
jgi:hypothetical protein